jgi:UDP-sugar transporter A1/2/3
VSTLWSELNKHRLILVYYMIPALFYCLYNNLSFVNLAYFDPTTYFMFMQIRMLLTGVIYQVRIIKVDCEKCPF